MPTFGSGLTIGAGLTFTAPPTTPSTIEYIVVAGAGGGGGNRGGGGGAGGMLTSESQSVSAGVTYTITNKTRSCSRIATGQDSIKKTRRCKLE